MMTKTIFKYSSDNRARFPRLLPLAAAPLFTVLLASCFAGKSNSAGGEVTGVGGSAWAEPTPYGMVLVDRGGYAMGPATDDSVWNVKANPRGVSVDAFWMDEPEITN